MKKVEELKLYAPEPKRPELDAALCMSVAEGQGVGRYIKGKVLTVAVWDKKEKPLVVWRFFGGYWTGELRGNENPKKSELSPREIEVRPCQCLTWRTEVPATKGESELLQNYFDDRRPGYLVGIVEDAYSQMLAAVQSFDALVKFGIAVSDETDDQGEHSIVLTASGAADSFSATLCKYITVTEVTSNIQFESAEYGSYVLADGVITQIVTTVDGWTACTNDIAPIKGRLTQTDAEARTSYTNRVASRGTGTVASIVSLLYSDVDGVTFAAGYENYNDTTDAAGRPPHSIEIVVQGGSDEDVANIIWKNKAGGIRAYGKHYAYATDINGNRQYLEFTRVNDVYLLLSVTVTSSGGLDDDYAARIKSLLMEEILSAGTTIRLQTFIRPIMESVSGVDYVEIRGLLSEKPDIEGVADNSMLTGIVPVEINQQPVLSMSGIRVVKA